MDLTRTDHFFEGSCWFNFSNLELALGVSFNLRKCVKMVETKIHKVWGLIPTFVEVTKEKLIGGPFCAPPIILNKKTEKHRTRVKNSSTERLAIIFGVPQSSILELLSFNNFLANFF